MDHAETVDGRRNHVAIVTGANHGIGAATAIELARGGASVLVTFLRLHDPVRDGRPEAYGQKVIDGVDYEYLAVPLSLPELYAFITPNAPAYRNATDRARALSSFMRYYNRFRPHSSLGDRPPISRVHNLRGQNT